MKRPVLWFRCWLWLAMLTLAGCSIAPPAAQPDAPPPAPEPVTVVVEPPPPPMPPAAQFFPEPDLWTRFRQARHWQRCEPDAGVQRWISRYAGKPQRFADSLSPLLPLMDYVLSHSVALGLPGETMLIPYVESHYRPDARGPAGALGMWQLMPDTGRRFGLSERGKSDGRTDVRASTEAALRLLKLNAEAFSNNPKLTFAAYNAGAYRLRKALGGRDYAAQRTLDGLGLSRTTREYLDKIKALGCLLGEPERFGMALPRFDVDQRLVEWKAPFPIQPEAVAKELGLDTTVLRALNRRVYAQQAATTDMPMLLPQGPSDSLEALVASGRFARTTPQLPKAEAPSSVAGRRVHKVASGDSLWIVAKRYRVRLADLMRWNGLTKRSVLRIGQTLVLEP